jgi:hypothetical protein
MQNRSRALENDDYNNETSADYRVIPCKADTSDRR